MKDLLYKSFAKTGGDQLVWKLDSSRLRILCYHGVCEDRLAGAPWMPRYFVTQSAFEAQLQYLQKNARLLPLAEAVRRLRAGSLPPRSVCLTFDDGYANNLRLAYPLLQKYAAPATIFLSSAYIESGDFYPFLKVKLIHLSGGRPPEYKSNPVDAVMEGAKTWWPQVESELTLDQRDSLRAMTIEELRTADPRLLDFGAHSHTHCILKNETAERRRQEIRTSVRKVAEWTGRPARLFSYPNGETGDFNEADKAALRAEGVEAAVTGVGGANDSSFDAFELKRYPLTLYHDAARFRAEVTGFRSALLSATGRMSA